jgi:small subunit ribosomal protein S6
LFPVSLAGGADSDRRKEYREPVTEYELLLLLDPELTEERQGEIITRLREQIAKGGGTVDRHDPWGKRRLSYEINKKADGIYHLLHFSASAETLDEVTRVLKIDDAVLRHLATRRIETGPGQALPVGGPPSDDIELEPAADLEEE